MAAMLTQLPLPLLPGSATEIAPGVGVVTGPEGGLVLVHGLATFAWDAGDEAGRRLAAGQLVRLRAAGQAPGAGAFGGDPVTVGRGRGPGVRPGGAVPAGRAAAGAACAGGRRAAGVRPAGVRRAAGRVLRPGRHAADPGVPGPGRGAAGRGGDPGPARGAGPGARPGPGAGGQDDPAQARRAGPGREGGGADHGAGPASRRRPARGPGVLVRRRARPRL